MLSPDLLPSSSIIIFFFNDTATTEIYTLSLHDALPISRRVLRLSQVVRTRSGDSGEALRPPPVRDRKSTRLNSSHVEISYAVFCLKKKKIMSILTWGINMYRL